MRRRWIAAAALVAALGMAGATAAAARPAGGMTVRRLSLVDPARALAAGPGFAGAATRRIDVTVWYPAARALRRRPLVLYSHGTYDSADSASYLVRALVARGYVVAAPDYPLTSRAAWTRITGPALTDVANQVRDIGFVIDGLLADPALGRAIDPQRIATVGHSLGAVTGFFASFGAGVREPRVAASVLLGGGNPLAAAQFSDMGLRDVKVAPAGVPVLFVSGEHDAIAGLTGAPYAAYAAVAAPRYEAMIGGGIHVWFRDGAEVPVDGRNPDCATLDQALPGVAVPGCGAERPRLTTAERQRAITVAAVGSFLDAYLKRDRAALDRLRALPATYPEVTLRRDDNAR